MKRIIALLLAATMSIALVACGKSEGDGVPNPMSEVSADDMEFSVNVPEGASDVKYFIIDDNGSKINQMTYTLDGKEYCYRMQSTGETVAYDMSGIFSDKWESENTAVSYCDAVAMTCSEGSVIYWMDVVPGINYTLSCAQQLSAEELSAAAEQLFVPMQGEASEASMDHPVVLADHLVDVGTITEFDENAALAKLEERYLGGGGCSCVVTQVDGKNLVGRNMDLSLSENTAFKFVLDINDYKAIGIAYSPFASGIVFDDVVANGVPEAIRATLPFTATDYLNEAGLYIQTNMRNTEEGYINHGTNPDSNIKIFSASIPGYVASRCKTVDEVVALVKEFNVYTAENPAPWNFCMTIADAEGNYGVLEIAKDKVSFLPGQNGQANYYITPEFAKDAKFPSGVDRFAVLNEGLDKVTTPEQMLKHMEKVFYSQCYNAEHLREADFDIRSEYSHTFPVNADGKFDKENGSYDNCTTAWITDDSRIDEVYDLIRQYVEANYGKYYTDGVCDFDAIRADAKNLPDYWVSAFSLAVDCSAKTMTARFWENTDTNLVFSFK